MSSSAARGQIVQDALALAGRSTELTQNANQWLNYFLLHVGLTFRFPELRKIGSQQTLAMGSGTASLPADLGAGMDKLGMIFGSDNRPLSELAFEDFAASGGFPQSSATTGRPRFYLVDRNAGKFKFNVPADVAYPFTPVYFITPPALSINSDDDNSKVWIDNDIIAVEGLVWFIYKFTEDAREGVQAVRVEKMLNDWKRESVKMGGSSRIQLSPGKFKTIRFGGYTGP